MKNVVYPGLLKYIIWDLMNEGCSATNTLQCYTEGKFYSTILFANDQPIQLPHTVYKQHFAEEIKNYCI